MLETETDSLVQPLNTVGLIALLAKKVAFRDVFISSKSTSKKGFTVTHRATVLQKTEQILSFLYATLSLALPLLSLHSASQLCSHLRIYQVLFKLSSAELQSKGEHNYKNVFPNKKNLWPVRCPSKPRV